MDLGGIAAAATAQPDGRYASLVFSHRTFAQLVTAVAWGAMGNPGESPRDRPVLGRYFAVPPSACCRRALGPYFAKPVRDCMLNALRSVRTGFWAALMVLAAGLGPFAVRWAIALHTTAVLGGVFAEALENAPTSPQHCR